MKLIAPILGFFLVPVLLNAASFDCSKAGTSNEIAICSDSELSEMDELLADIYKKARNSTSNKDKLKKEQISWIKSIATCDGNVDCLTEAYAARINVLDYIDGYLSIFIDPTSETTALLNEKLITFEQEALVLNRLLEQKEDDNGVLARQVRIMNGQVERLEDEKVALESVVGTLESDMAALQRDLDILKIEQENITQPKASEAVVQIEPPTDNTIPKTVSSGQIELVFDLEAATATCTEKWTKRGVLKGDMFSFCLEQQTDGWGEALTLYNKYSFYEPVEMIDEVVQYALGKWLTRGSYDFGMVAFEIEVQGEAYLNVKYDVDAGKFSSSDFTGCKFKWLTQEEPKWNMVEYCLNK